MLVGPMITDSRSAILDPKYAELFKRSENIQDGPSMQYKKLVHEHDFIPVKSTRAEILLFNVLHVMRTFVNHVVRV